MILWKSSSHYFQKCHTYMLILTIPWGHGRLMDPAGHQKLGQHREWFTNRNQPAYQKYRRSHGTHQPGKHSLGIGQLVRCFTEKHGGELFHQIPWPFKSLGWIAHVMTLACSIHRTRKKEILFWSHGTGPMTYAWQGFFLTKVVWGWKSGRWSTKDFGLPPLQAYP